MNSLDLHCVVLDILIITRLVQAGAPYWKETNQSDEDESPCPILTHATELSQGEYAFLKSKVVEALVSGEAKRQKIELVAMRVSVHTSLIPNIGKIIAHYCIEIPLFLHKAYQQTL